MAVEFDALRISELACFETAARRFQMWEEFYSAQLQKNEGSHTGLSMDEQGAFLGQSAKGLSLVSPLLGEYVSKQIAERTSVLKERRKATEERNEQRKLTARGGGGGGGGGAGEEGGGGGRGGKKQGRGRGRGRGEGE